MYAIITVIDDDGKIVAENKIVHPVSRQIDEDGYAVFEKYKFLFTIWEFVRLKDESHGD